MGKHDVDKKTGVDMDAEMKDIDNDVHGSYEAQLKEKKENLARKIVDVYDNKDSTPFNKGYANLKADSAERELVRLVKNKKRK